MSRANVPVQARALAELDATALQEPGAAPADRRQAVESQALKALRFDGAVRTIGGRF